MSLVESLWGGRVLAYRPLTVLYFCYTWGSVSTGNKNRLLLLAVG